jgi:rubredoxin
MSKTEACAHGSTAPYKILENLHESQAGAGRHKCPACAYRLGIEAGITKRLGGAPDGVEKAIERCDEGSSAPKSILRSLPIYQGGTGRHKCPVCAYKQGYDYGLSQQEIRPQDIPVDIAVKLKPFPDVDEENLSVKEGKSRWVQHFRRERNVKIVSAKKAQVLKKTGSLKCEVCEFDFKERYGDLGEGFCEAHHIQPLSTLNQQTETRLEDLAILCSNCHRIIHRTKPVMTVVAFKRLVATVRRK